MPANRHTTLTYLASLPGLLLVCSLLLACQVTLASTRLDDSSAAQDLYATGVTLYYLLTGHYPYGEIEAFQRPRFGPCIVGKQGRGRIGLILLHRKIADPPKPVSQRSRCA